MSEHLDPAQLFKDHHEELFRYLVRLSNDPEVAQDAVQHAFLRLLKSSPRPGSARAWLYRVASNAVLEWDRSGKRRAQLVAANSEVPGLGSPAPAPDASAEAAEARTRLARVLEQLAPRERTLLLMREEGFTHKEMAEVVGTTTGSVGTMLARALRKAARVMAGGVES